MINKNLIIIIFYLTQFLFPAISVAQTKSAALFIEKIKIDDSIPIWGDMILWSGAEYKKLNTNGIPIDLKIGVIMHTISFKISSSDSTNSSFRYKLIGFNKQWKCTSVQNELKYSQLKNGHYILSVESINGNSKLDYKFTIFYGYKNTITNDLSSLFIISILCAILISATKKVKKTKT